MSLQLNRNELSALIFVIAKLIDEAATAELVVDLTVDSAIVNSYADLLGLEDNRALAILNDYGKFFMGVIDAKMQASARKAPRLIGSINGGLDL